jgi:hypothetical protein
MKTPKNKKTSKKIFFVDKQIEKEIVLKIRFGGSLGQYKKTFGMLYGFKNKIEFYNTILDKLHQYAVQESRISELICHMDDFIAKKSPNYPEFFNSVSMDSRTGIVSYKEVNSGINDQKEFSQSITNAKAAGLNLYLSFGKNPQNNQLHKTFYRIRFR